MPKKEEGVKEGGGSQGGKREGVAFINKNTISTKTRGGRVTANAHMHIQVAFINENSINVKTEGGGRYGTALQECAVYPLMSVRMATNVIEVVSSQRKVLHSVSSFP